MSFSRISGQNFRADLLERTSAVYFANGTAVAIAKLEGSSGYKRFMRLEDADTTSARAYCLPEHFSSPVHEGWLAHLNQALQRPLQLLRGRPQNECADITPVEAMFRALKVSTESYLGTAIGISDVAVPYLLPDSHCYQMGSALTNVGIQHALNTPVLAGQVASRANGIGECSKDSCDFDGVKPQLVLTIDYSRAALTMILFVEDRGVYEHFRLQHNIDLGAEASKHISRSTQAYWEEVKEAVRDITKTPVKGAEPDVPDVIGQLVLLGECATDPHLLRVLTEVLGEGTFSKMHSSSAAGNSVLVDPVFAAAIGVAAASRKAQIESNADVLEGLTDNREGLEL